MGLVKEINIKNQTYYFFEDMISIINCHSNLLKVEKKLYKDIDIYYIGYIMIKEFVGCENIRSVNPLHLMIHPATEHFKERNNEKYLILDSTDKYEEVGPELDQKLKHLIVEKNCFVKKTVLKLELILMMIYLWVNH